jgi:hypothetical protein
MVLSCQIKVVLEAADRMDQSLQGGIQKLLVLCYYLLYSLRYRLFRSYVAYSNDITDDDRREKRPYGAARAW